MSANDNWACCWGACGSRFEGCTYSSEVRKAPPLRAVTIELRRHPMFAASTAPLIGPNSLFEMLRATQALSSGAL